MTQESHVQNLSSSPKPSRLKTQEEPVFQFKFKAGKSLVSQLNSQAGGGANSYLRIGLCVLCSLQLFGWGPARLGRAIYFTQSSDSNVNLIKNRSLGHTQINIWPTTWAPLAQLIWNMKLSITAVLPANTRAITNDMHKRRQSLRNILTKIVRTWWWVNEIFSIPSAYDRVGDLQEQHNTHTHTHPKVKG